MSRTVDAVVRYRIRVHGGSWWDRLVVRIALAIQWRRMRVTYDHTGKVVWDGVIDACVDPSTCTRPRCVEVFLMGER